MDTNFTKFDDDFPPAWSNFSRAGVAWLSSLEVLIDHRDDTYMGVFYAEPTIIALTLELFAKAIAAHEDVKLKARNDFGHSTSKLLLVYQDRIDLFKKIVADKELLSLIREYEKTIGVRYGEMGVNINSTERQKLIDLIYEMRAELSKRTGIN